MSSIKWLPLESNRDVMNKCLANLGVPANWGISDVVSMDEELIDMIPVPSLALLLLFPMINKYTEYCEKQELLKENQQVVDGVYYIKQTIRNGCGTIALIHVIANNESKLNLQADSVLKKFIDSTKELSPEERGKVLEQNLDISAVHESSAQEGQTEAPNLDDEVNLHSIAIVNVNEKLNELVTSKKKSCFCAGCFCAACTRAGRLAVHEEDLAFSVDPEEIPAIPANNFLMRKTSPVAEFRRSNLETMLSTYCKPCESGDESLVEAQMKAINDVVQELVRQLTQPNNCVREQTLKAYIRIFVNDLSQDSSSVEVRLAVVKESKLFEWVDGPLIQAMQEGNFFLSDEISLADDSVLERLNSVLEPEQKILLAERSFDDSDQPEITAKEGFHFLATMNPGGDYGKKEDITDLFGADLPVDGGEKGEFAWRDGPIIQALKKGDWILLDEMNLASQSVLEGLNACLDHRNEIYIPELGRAFHLDKNVSRIFCCQNPQRQGGSRKGLPQSFLNRFTQGFISLLDNPVAVKSLVNVLPKLYRIFHDNSEKVRIAFCEFLIKLEKIPDCKVKYFHIVPEKHLYDRLREDCPAVKKGITNLLSSSFFERDKYPKTWLRCCLQMFKNERAASFQFFTYVSKFIGLENSSQESNGILSPQSLCKRFWISVAKQDICSC